MTGLRVEKFTGSRVTSILEAENATWKADPDRWQLSQWSVRTFDGLKETYRWYLKNHTPPKHDFRFEDQMLAKALAAAPQPVLVKK